MRIVSQFLLFIIFPLLFSVPSYCSNYTLISGACEAGMANTSVSLSGPWSLFHNPAGLAMCQYPGVLINYNNRYQLKELSTNSVAGIIPVDYGCFGISVNYFGTAHYNEQKYSFGYSRRLGKKISAGILCDYFISKFPSEYESAHTLAGEVGILVMPIDKLSIGVHVFNISGSKYKTFENESIPVLFSAGASWQDDLFLISSQVQLDNEGNECLSIGSEVALIKNFFIRAGISNNNQTNYSFGIGYKINRFVCDVAFTNHPVLGISSAISLQYSFSGHSR